MKRTETIVLRVSWEEKQAIRRLSDLEDSTMSYWVRTAIRMRLRDQRAEKRGLRRRASTDDGAGNGAQ